MQKNLKAMMKKMRMKFHSRTRDFLIWQDILTPKAEGGKITFSDASVLSDFAI